MYKPVNKLPSLLCTVHHMSIRRIIQSPHLYGEMPPWSYLTQMRNISDQRWQPSKEMQDDLQAAKAQTSSYQFAAQVDGARHKDQRTTRRYQMVGKVGL